MAKLKNKKTSRGFDRFDFKDQYGLDCSLQKSSLIDPECIWLGAHTEVKILLPGEGWTKVDVEKVVLQHYGNPKNSVTGEPADVLVSSRMHLSQEQVKKLLPLLQKFAETGELT